MDFVGLFRLDATCIGLVVPLCVRAATLVFSGRID